MGGEKVTKASVLTAGVGCVTAGVGLAKEGSPLYGVALALIGFGLVMAYIHLLDREVERMVRRLGR
jgi:hypothetical protein